MEEGLIFFSELIVGEWLELDQSPTILKLGKESDLKMVRNGSIYLMFYRHPINLFFFLGDRH
jgi:hypothetical protein